MSGIGRQLAAEHPESGNLPEIRVVPLPTQTTGRVQLSLAVLFGSVFLMLLIACINVGESAARSRIGARARILGPKGFGRGPRDDSPRNF